MYSKILKSAPKVLVIDDDGDFANIVCAIARYQGFDAVAVRPDKYLGRAIVNSDLLVLDLAMPGMNGVDVLREVADEKIATKVVLLSGVRLDLLEQCKNDALEWGVQVVQALSKPVRVAELKDCFRTLLSDR
ncbi:MAG: response regulator transcription factor [Gammaproteobacteria bacterium]|nr:MAG: response regulator transcription factor [Gammaproteobacteria bacterium]